MPPLLEVQDLRTHFSTPEGVVRAVDGISYDIREGEVVALVGESGCGKSVSALSIMRLIPTPPGRIVMTSLNPVLTIGRQLTEPLEVHLGLGSAEAARRAAELLSLVGIPDAERRLAQYPHQFSGGMRQRIMIAMALACRPRLILADEPTTALDVTIQAQILELLKDLSQRFGVAMLIITHNLGVVARYADRVNVMYAGRIIERGTARQIYHDPRHSYALGLLRSVPRLDQPRKGRLDPIEGQPPDLARPLPGCRFAPRCRFALPRCAHDLPPLLPIGDDHLSACWVAD
ncbi:MAG: ABC transporter ATP-binding protein, partial [candidate division NC10 bacterium]|nr:ABC transporter ATP-binding protein [candidate division NC10 bacterium]